MMRHDTAAWRQKAIDLGLKVLTAPDCHEISIFRDGDPDRGFLWVSPGDLMKIEGGDKMVITVTPEEALAVLRRLAEKI